MATPQTLHYSKPNWDLCEGVINRPYVTVSRQESNPPQINYKRPCFLSHREPIRPGSVGLDFPPIQTIIRKKNPRPIIQFPRVRPINQPPLKSLGPRHGNPNLNIGNRGQEQDRPETGGIYGGARGLEKIPTGIFPCYSNSSKSATLRAFINRETDKRRMAELCHPPGLIKVMAHIPMNIYS